MMRFTVLRLFVILTVLMFAAPVIAQDLQRGLRNYQDIISGKKKLDQLSAQEKQEVIIIHRRV
jgi:cell division protein FtsB